MTRRMAGRHRSRRRSSEEPLMLAPVGSSLGATSGELTLADAQEGDFVLATVFSRGEANVSTPSGWTSVYAPSLSGLTVYRIICKILGPGDTTIPTSSGRNRVNATIFRPSRPLASFSAKSFTQQNSTGNPSAITATGSGGVTPCIVMGGGFTLDGATISLSTASPAFDETFVNADNNLITAWKLYHSSPANHTVDINDFGYWQGVFGGRIELA